MQASGQEGVVTVRDVYGEVLTALSDAEAIELLFGRR
jgi:hypothetical protein